MLRSLPPTLLIRLIDDLIELMTAFRYLLSTPQEPEEINTDVSLVTSGTRSGRTITFTTVVTNNGNTAVTDLTTTCGLTADSWQESSLAAGASKTYTHTYTITEDDLIAGYVFCTTQLTGTSPNPDNSSFSLSDETTVMAPGYQLRIHYAFIDESHRLDPEYYTEYLMYDEPYSIDSPEVTGYTPDKPTVSGTMPARSVIYTVYYTADETEPTIQPDEPYNGTLSVRAKNITEGQAEVLVITVDNSYTGTVTETSSGISTTASNGKAQITIEGLSAGTYTFTVVAGLKTATDTCIVSAPVTPT